MAISQASPLEAYGLNIKEAAIVMRKSYKLKAIGQAKDKIFEHKYPEDL